MMVNNKKKAFSLSRQSLILVSAILFLLVLAWFLNNRLAGLTRDNLKNLATLKQVLPDFNNKTLNQFKQDIGQLETQLAALAELFDPAQQQIKKDYDLPIYFVEELGKIKQALKTKATDKKISNPDLGFKETLPDEKEAKYLLKQLYLIRDIVSTGMDCNVNFSTVTPLPLEDLSISSGMKLAKIRIEFTAQPQALIDFLIQISEITPLDSVETILIKSQDSTLKADMALSNIVIESGWKNKAVKFTPLNVKEMFPEQERIINSLRANNPFSLAKAVEPAGAPPQAPAQPRQSPRFLYLGKAILKSKDVAVIEDTLSKETIFLAPNEKTGDFILKDLNELQITLQNINTGQEIVVKRQEQ